MPYKFNKHPELEGHHAVLSASKYSWIRYSDEKFIDSFRTQQAAQYGTELHELAKELINKRIKLAETGQTFNLYVNDCIGFRMKPEVLVMYSTDAFGTADALSFDPVTKELRIFDLKTGVNEAKFDQLMIYAVYFAVEYGFKLPELNIVLRIYQNDEIKELVPDLEDLMHIYERLTTFSTYIYEIRKEAIRD